MIRIPLHDDWTLDAVAGSAAHQVPEHLPACVPGSVHLDLLAAGVIPDPYVADNAERLGWLFDIDWHYGTTLDSTRVDLSAPADDERVELAFDGLDTFAEVRFAGHELGRTTNMHRSWRFDVSDQLDGGDRTLDVTFASATRVAEDAGERQHHRPSAYPTPFNSVRKMAASFGWDWGPDLRTAGIWRAVRLERWRTARLAQVRPLVTVVDGRGRVELTVDLEWAADRSVRLIAEVLGHRGEINVPAGQRRASLTVEVDDPPLWWPTGYGAQPLADLTVQLDCDGEQLDAWSRRIGFRTVELDVAPDEYGTGFTLKVNGRPIFVKGANWIPDDHFLTRITRQRLDRRMDQAVAANLNLVRVWGGGTYESEDFYEACDERGLMVWQDFLLACAAYAEEEPLRSEIEAEASENIVRMMSHPSLVVYNGGNENVWGYEDWGWKEKLEGRSWGGWYAQELFQRLVGELDPSRPYSVNSPYSPGASATGIHPNDPNHGTHHQWEVWNRIDYTHYRDDIPRFCSEFGYQGPPTWRTLQDWLPVDGTPITELPNAKEHPVFLVHQKAEDGNAKLDTGMAPHLGVPEDFEDWHWATQLQQAHAVTYALDHYRRHWPRTAGAIVWQLNDCWPVTSWAAIDYEERPKPLYYGMRQAFSPRRLLVAASGEGLVVSAVNDTDEPWSGVLRVRRESLDGKLLADQSIDIDCGTRSVATRSIEGAVRTAGDPHREVLVAELDQERAIHAFVEIKDLELQPDPFRAQVRETDEGYEIRVEATSLVLDLTALVDKLDPEASADTALLSLPAGATGTIKVRCSTALSDGSLLDPRVLRSANQLAVLARERQSDPNAA